MSNLKQLVEIDNLNARAALQRLAEVYRDSRQAQQTIPYVSLFLKSGLTMSGQVLALSNDSGPATVLILLHDPNKSEPTDLTYVMVDQIAGLTIHGAMVMIEYLSDGKITRPLGTPPTLAELQSELQAIITDINRITEGAMTAEPLNIPANSSPEVMHTLNTSIRDLGAVLRKMATEELMRQALKEKNFKFSFKLGEEATVQVDRTQYVIVISQGPKGVERVSRESLRSNIEEFI